MNNEYPHVPAAFINAIREEGTKEEACDWLQKTWNELCSLREDYKIVVRRNTQLKNELAEYKIEMSDYEILLNRRSKDRIDVV